MRHAMIVVFDCYMWPSVVSAESPEPSSTPVMDANFVWKKATNEGNWYTIRPSVPELYVTRRIEDEEVVRRVRFGTT